MSEIVNITMFGGKGFFGGREAKKEAVISKCAFADLCPAFQAGRCASNNPRLESCINMENETVIGVTSRSSKHGEFVRKWKGHEKYSSIKEGLKRFEYVGDDKVRIKLPHIDVHSAMQDKHGYDAYTVKSEYYVDRKELTVDALRKIMKSYSTPLMGGRLDNKEEKDEMLLAIKEVDRELYNEYMNISDYKMNYIGKIAYLNTLKHNIVLSDGWFWDGKFMKRSSMGSVNCSAIRGFVSGEEVSFIPAEDSLVKIEDESWITDTTKFKD